jgi:hypothetical protein
LGRCNSQKPGETAIFKAELGHMTAGFPMGLASLMRERAGSLPPVERWHPAHCGDSFMRIARDGTWFHEGAPIRRPELVRLFSGLLRKDEEGFMLVTPAEKLSIAVEDAPFLAVLLRIEGEGPSQRLIFTTNVGDETEAGADHPLRFAQKDETHIPYVHVRGKLEARLARPVYYQLMENLAEVEGRPGVWSGGCFFPLALA